MPKKSLIETVYDFLRAKKENFSFEKLWNLLKDSVESRNIDSARAELYTELVLDNRFALTSEGKWGLRDLLKYEDVKKQYDYVDKFVTTEEFDNTAQYSDNLEQTRVIDINKKFIEKEKYAGYDDDDMTDSDSDIYDSDDSDDYSEDYDNDSEGFE